MKLLDRYIICESLQFLIIGSIAILGIFFGTVEFQNCLKMMNNFGLPLNTVLSVTLLQVPTGINYCLPAGVLISSMLLIIRQHNDAEILALEVSGVKLQRIMAPFLAMGVVAAVLAFMISEHVAPQARLLSEKLTLIGIYGSSRPFTGRTSIEYKDQSGKPQQILMFGKPDGKTIKGFLVIDKATKERVKLIWAEEGAWSNGTWRLTRGQVFEFFNPDSNGLGGTFGAMTYGNNQAMLQCIKAGPLCDLSKTTSQMQHEIKSLKSANQTVPLELLLQFYRRYSHPVSCILLILAAMPVALLRSRRSHSTAIVYAGVLVVAYFILQQICLSLAVNGRLDPILGAWLPGTVLCIFGLGLTLILRNR